MFGEISQRLRGEQSPYVIPITIAPSVGPGLVVKAAANAGGANAAIDLWAAGANGYSSIQWYDSAGSIRTGRLNAYSGTGGGLGGRELNIGMDGSAATDALTLGTGFATRLRITGQGAISISAPSSGLQALTVTGVAGSSALQVLTTGIQVGAPTGGDQGGGTINIAGGMGGLYLNGTALQALAPTWTAAHIFSALLTANLGITVAGATLKVAVGTTALAPITFQSGSLLTTAAAGATEYDGKLLYFSPAASSRAVALSEYVCLMNGTKTLTSQTAAQAIFNATANGAVTLPIGTYLFDCEFSLTAMSTVTGGFGFALGGTATFTQSWTSVGANAAAATATNPQMTSNTAANTAIVTPTTAGVGYAKLKGVLRVSVAGTVIPQVSLATAAAAVVSTNSFFACAPRGPLSTSTTVGNWS